MLNVIKNRYLYLGFAGILVLFSLFMIFFTKLNLGIDMTGGSQSEYTYSGEFNFEEIKSGIEKLKDDFNTENNGIINGLSVYTVTGEEKLVLETGFNSISDEKLLANYKTSYNELVIDYLVSKNETFKMNKYQDIGQSFGDYIKKTAIITLIISLVAISFYLAYAFHGIALGFNTLTFGGITLITLFHDVIVAAGLYILTGIFFPEFKVDTFFVTALLTILGYSINDTIVVFDRIRENIKTHLKKMNLDEIINSSINETLARSIFTSLTVLLVLIAIFLFGPEALKGFMLALIFGTVFGTYSSIFVSSPLLYELNKDKKLQVYEKKEVKVEDKIIV